MNGLENKEFTLGNRSVRNIGTNVAVMYEVPGVLIRNKFTAHLTVYFGPIDGADKY